MRLARPDLKRLVEALDGRALALLYAADAYAMWNLGKDLLVTSAWREGDPGVHGKKRAADIAVDGELSQEQQSRLASWINSTFPYGIVKPDGRPYLSALIEKKGTNYGTRPATGNCIHLQVRSL